MPSSSSSAASLTVEAVSAMTPEQLIALVYDDKRMVKVSKNAEVRGKLYKCIFKLMRAGRLLPEKSLHENRKLGRELLNHIMDFEAIWNHFAPDPPKVWRTFSRSSQNRRHGEEPNRENTDPELHNSGSKRAAMSQSAAEGSAEGGEPKRTKFSSSQSFTKETLEVPDYFMPLYAERWDMCGEADSKAAVKLFSEKREMFLNDCYNPPFHSYDCFPVSEVRNYLLKVLTYVTELQTQKILTNVVTAKPANIIDTKWETFINFTGFTFHRNADVQIIVMDGAEDCELFNRIEELCKTCSGESGLTDTKRAELESLQEARIKLKKDAFMTVVECKTPATFDDDPIKLIDEYYSKKWAPNNQEVAREANPDRFKKFETAIQNAVPGSIQSSAAQGSKDDDQRVVESPIAELCLYMMSKDNKFGALTNGLKTYFFRRHRNPRTVEVSEAFYSNRDDGIGHTNPGNWSLGQAWLVFLYHALKDHQVSRFKDFDWLRDSSPLTDIRINKIIHGEIEVTTDIREDPPQYSASASGTGEDGNSNGTSESRNHGAPRDPTVKAVFRLGPNMETSNMRTILEDEAMAYPDIMINGVSSFVKTTYAPHDARYTLEGEGEVYAALHMLQGDAIPRVTACGIDEMLNLAVFATEQCGTSMSEMQPRKRKEHGGVRKLYWKAALCLEKIHAAGFIHGDVALRNIVVDSASNVKFIDLQNSERSRSDSLREEEFDDLACIFNIDSAHDFRTLSRVNNTESHAESNELV